MAPALVGADRTDLSELAMPSHDELRGLRFWKMTGSGNDFVFIDGRAGDVDRFAGAEAIDRLCSRTDGVGADGVVFLEGHPSEPLAIRYYNRDGSRGELCGNASLCASSLAVRLGLAPAEGFRFSTDVGPINARIVAGQPEIDLRPIQGLRPDAGIALAAGESRIGFADSGVPHLVVLVDDSDAVPLMARGAELRHHPSLRTGANVNFISRAGAKWRLRTYERGVEGETQACGTGSVACAALLAAWGLEAGPTVQLLTSSGRTLTVTLPAATEGARPSLRGEGRLVFAGELVDP